MAKFKAKKVDAKAVHTSEWDNFQGLMAEGGYSITYNPTTGRGVLKVGDDFKVSDMTLISIKRHAEIHHGVPLSAWKNVQT